MAASKTFVSGSILTAADVNTHLNPSTAAHVPYAVAAGTMTVAGTGATTASTTAPLPAGRFTLVPIVTPTTWSSVYIAFRAGGTSSTQVEVGIRRFDGAPIPSGASVNVTWHAVQMTPTSAAG